MEHTVTLSSVILEHKPHSLVLQQLFIKKRQHPVIMHVTQFLGPPRIGILPDPVFRVGQNVVDAVLGVWSEGEMRETSSPGLRTFVHHRLRH